MFRGRSATHYCWLARKPLGHNMNGIIKEIKVTLDTQLTEFNKLVGLRRKYILAIFHCFHHLHIVGLCILMLWHAKVLCIIFPLWGDPVTGTVPSQRVSNAGHFVFTLLLCWTSWRTNGRIRQRFGTLLCNANICVSFVVILKLLNKRSSCQLLGRQWASWKYKVMILMSRTFTKANV